MKWIVITAVVVLCVVLIGVGLLAFWVHMLEKL